MDVKVYKKETVRQPNGVEYVMTPNIIDIYPELVEKIPEQEFSLEKKTIGAELLTDTDDLVEQSCALATIWQKGLDPLDLDVGVRWSEALLDEINAVQLMEDITNAVAAITPSVTVVFDTVKDANGNTYLKYTLKAVA